MEGLCGSRNDLHCFLLEISWNEWIKTLGRVAELYIISLIAFYEFLYEAALPPRESRNNRVDLRARDNKYT